MRNTRTGKRRRQAEFLVHRFFPWTSFESVGVHNGDVAEELAALLETEPHRPAISVRPRTGIIEVGHGTQD